MNRVAIVTGGTSGIGLATAQALAGRGREGLRRQPPSPLALEGLCTASSPTCPTRRASPPPSARCMRARGGWTFSSTTRASASPARRNSLTTPRPNALLDVNLFGMVNATKAVLPLMRAQGGGRIVSISSVAAPLPIPFQAWYSVSKAAINAYTAGAVQRGQADGRVSVCAVMPGDIRTGFTAARAKSDAGRRRVRRTHRPLGGQDGKGRARTAWLPPSPAACIAKVALKKRVKPLYAIGLEYKFFVMLSRLLPIRNHRLAAGPALFRKVIFVSFAEEKACSFTCFKWTKASRSAVRKCWPDADFPL